MEQRHLLALLILLMGYSHLLCARPVALPGSLVGENQKESVSDVPDKMGVEEETKMLVEEFVIHGRMDAESTDYPGSGANNRHDPKTPGRV